MHPETNTFSEDRLKDYMSFRKMTTHQVALMFFIAWMFSSAILGSVMWTPVVALLMSMVYFAPEEGSLLGVSVMFWACISSMLIGSTGIGALLFLAGMVMFMAGHIKGLRKGFLIFASGQRIPESYK